MPRKRSITRSTAGQAQPTAAKGVNKIITMVLRPEGSGRKGEVMRDITARNRRCLAAAAIRPQRYSQQYLPPDMR